MGYYVYILSSEKDGNFYVGQTSNIEKRLIAHNTGRVRSTRHRKPLKLVHFEEFRSRGEAMKRERWLKSLESAGFKAALRSKKLSW